MSQGQNLLSYHDHAGTSIYQPSEGLKSQGQGHISANEKVHVN